MNKQIITFSADEQKLVKTGGINCYASNIVSYIEAHFDLGENWSGYDSVRAVWSNDNNMTVISTVLDSGGVCVVPFEVLKTKGTVMVNLVGSISASDVLTDRLTTFPCEAVKVARKAKINGSETTPITPSQFEQYVEAVISEVEKVTGMTAEAETLPAGSSATARYENGVLYLGIPQGIQGIQGEAGADGADGNGIAQVLYNSDYSITFVFTNGERFTTPSLRGETGPQGIPGPAGQDGRDGTDGRDGIDGTNGVTPSLSVGTVTTLPSTEDAYVTRRGTDENPVFDFGIPQGPKGDTGEVSQAEFDAAVSDLKSDIGYVKSNTPYNDATPTGTAISTTNRWFLEGFAYGTIDSVTIRFRLAGGITIEVWEKNGNELTRIYSSSESSADNYSYKTFNVGVSSIYPMMVSIISDTTNGISDIVDTATAFSAKCISDKTSTLLAYSKLSAFAGLNVTGYITYHVTDLSKISELERKKVGYIEAKSIFGAEEKNTVYNTNASTGTVVSNTNRWFLNGFSYGYIESISIRCKTKDSIIKIELWELADGILTRVLEKDVVSYLDYGWNDFEINYASNNPVLVSVYSADGNTVNQITDTSLDFNAYRTNDLLSTTLAFSSLTTFTGLCVLGYVTYISVPKQAKSNFITVAPDGSADYTNIADAVTSANDGDTILVYSGTYTEPIEAWGKTLNIIGVDKDSCIITNDTGNYSTPAVEIDSGRIANFTIISTGANPTCDASDVSNYMRDYSIHVDHKHATGRTLIIEDCIIRNNHRTALGMGCYADNTVIVRNCDIWADVPPSDIQNPLWNKRGVLYFHNRQPSAYFSNITGQKMRFINNTMYCEDIIAVYIGDTCDGVDMDEHGWINEMEVEFINNMICAKYADGTYKTSSNGIAKPTAFTNDSIISGTGFTQHLKLSPISYGNNVAYLNA